MQSLRTPDARFLNLPGYPFAPHYTMLDSLRMHYVDEGGAEKAPVLMLHGEPSWSYLYRKMIPLFVAGGYRAVAPDLIGFGKSDKPTQREDYSYQRHVDWVYQFIEALDLKDITLVCQDWGSLLGLRIAAEHPERFSRIAVANGFLPAGQSDKIPTAFRVWRAFARYTPWFPIGRILQSGCATTLTPEERAAYDAPFPDDRYKEGTRAFPQLVPTALNDPAMPANQRAWQELGRWQKPFLTAFASRDPITRGAERTLQKQVPGAAGQPHTIIHGAGHFIQEDKGEELARVVLSWMK
jgi:haloalkane dehalogenase